MKRISTNTAAMLYVFGLVVFWPFNAVFGADIMLEVGANFGLGAALAISLNWLLPAVSAVRRGGREAPNFLSLALFTWAIGTATHRLWVNMMRWLERPEWMLESSFTAYAVWMVFIGMALVILAPGTERGVVPRSNFFWLLSSVAFGALFAGIMIGKSLFGQP